MLGHLWLDKSIGLTRQCHGKYVFSSEAFMAICSQDVNLQGIESVNELEGGRAISGLLIGLLRRKDP